MTLEMKRRVSQKIHPFIKPAPIHQASSKPPSYTY
uniref:Uncharacterized protein n=1 Tax=Podoviridae sp. ctKmJ5 TaxID=2827732 RepID=A0A8S5SZM8_9CAUD|nr:MAG TPA: hypothetical protein [Podoviridae sp. ctKmJ5]